MARHNPRPGAVFWLLRLECFKAVNSEDQVLGGSPQLESWLVNEVTSHSSRVPKYLPFAINMISSKDITEVSYKVHILGKGSSSMWGVITRLRTMVTMVIHHLLNGMILGSQIAEIGCETRCFNHSYRTLRLSQRGQKVTSEVTGIIGWWWKWR